MSLEAPFRAATPDDAVAMAKLVNIAGEGLAAHQWERLAGPGETAWDLGQQRARRETGGFSYRNTVLVDVDGEVCAALIGYPLAEEPEPVDYDELPPMFVPLQELEDEVPGTWYVNVLAAFPEHRGKGYGGALLKLAESLARDAGSRGMSLIVSDANTGARRLYERAGYVERGTRPMVKEDWQNPGQNWVLLVKPF
ncbi:MAG: GNAT family N-acetyltransferase [Pseudomonadota bacterium]